MSRWFPDVETYEGIEQARKGGIAGALAFAATIVVGIGITMAMGRYPGDVAAVTIPMFVGMFLELAVVLFTAWRFKIGKGSPGARSRCWPSQSSSSRSSRMARPASAGFFSTRPSPPD